jgi:hypothetical protein
MIAVALLAVFAAGSVVHVASATTVSLQMALADGAAMDMADCEGCGTGGDGDESGLACGTVCVAPFTATLAQENASGLRVVAKSPAPSGVHDFVGRTGPPDPYPPRTLI